MLKFFSKEFRVGFIIVVALVIAYYGTLYLKNYGKMNSQKIYYVTTSNVEGMVLDMQILINGMVVGKVGEIKPLGSRFESFVLGLYMNDDMTIPLDSRLVLKNNMLAVNQIILVLGVDNRFLNKGDTLSYPFKNDDVGIKGFLGKTDKLSDSIQRLVSQASSLLDGDMRKNMSESAKRLSITLKHLEHFTRVLDSSGKLLVGSLKGTQNFMTNLNTQNDNINKSLKNLSDFSGVLGSGGVKKMVADLGLVTEKLGGILQKIENKEGSLGLLVYDRKLYDNLDGNIQKFEWFVDRFEGKSKAIRACVGFWQRKTTRFRF